jgi:hypothetical protein
MLGVITANRALRMQKDQCPKRRTIHPSDSGRQASERLSCVCISARERGSPMTGVGARMDMQCLPGDETCRF